MVFSLLPLIVHVNWESTGSLNSQIWGLHGLAFSIQPGMRKMTSSLQLPYKAVSKWCVLQSEPVYYFYLLKFFAITKRINRRHWCNSDPVQSTPTTRASLRLEIKPVTSSVQKSKQIYFCFLCSEMFFFCVCISQYVTPIIRLLFNELVRCLRFGGNILHCQKSHFGKERLPLSPSWSHYRTAQQLDESSSLIQFWRRA